MSSQGQTPQASFPIPPPLAKVPFVDMKTGVLSQIGIGFMTALWAAIQGGGGLIPSLLVITLPVAGSVVGYTAVSINAIGQVISPDNTVISDGLAVFGVATSSGSTGTSVTVQAIGMVTNSAWVWAPGEPVWCDNAGVLTQTVPTGAGIWVKKVGVAVSFTDLYLGFGELIELT